MISTYTFVTDADVGEDSATALSISIQVRTSQFNRRPVHASIRVHINCSAAM
jgi:hypothetical protein